MRSQDEDTVAGHNGAEGYLRARPYRVLVVVSSEDERFSRRENFGAEDRHSTMTS